MMFIQKPAGTQGLLIYFSLEQLTFFARLWAGLRQHQQHLSLAFIAIAVYLESGMGCVPKSRSHTLIEL